jgi:hypothetical protein
MALSLLELYRRSDASDLGRWLVGVASELVHADADAEACPASEPGVDGDDEPAGRVLDHGRGAPTRPPRPGRRLNADQAAVLRSLCASAPAGEGELR